MPSSKNRQVLSKTVGHSSFQSDDSSDGFRLVDDDGDSLMGSVADQPMDVEGGQVATKDTSTDDEAEFGGERSDENLDYLNGGDSDCVEGSISDAGESNSTPAGATTTTASEEQLEQEKQLQDLYQIGHTAIKCSRIFFFIVWVITTISVTIPIYKETTNLVQGSQNDTNQPVKFVVGIVVMAICILVAFGFYDRCVQSRHRLLVMEAFKSKKLVSSLFPSNVHDRLMNKTTTGSATIHRTGDNDIEDEERPIIVHHLTSNGDNNDNNNHYDASIESNNDVMITNMGTITEEEGNKKMKNGARQQQPQQQTKSGGDGTASLEGNSLHSSRGSLGRIDPPMQRLRSFLTDSLPLQSEHGTSASKQSHDTSTIKDEPIADLFPDCTVMFADISGFTAWSSIREPSQVFKLLETIYRSFDKLAKRNKVFKVETIGDCYVAVTGLPDPQPDHALIMVKFARECKSKMTELTEDLELTLGPGTSELCMRFGLHSGPVTAGVLRGSRSRFQLFGDTVNFASRMETTGQKNKIHTSKATADLLIAAGKEDWITQREDLVNAKGLGQVQTFWVTPRRSTNGSTLDDGGELIKLKSKRKGLNMNRDSSRRGMSSSRRNMMSSSRRNMMDQASSRRSLLSVSQLSNDDIWSSDKRIDVEPGGGAYDINRQERLIDWNVEILMELLKRIAAHRVATCIQESEERVDVNKYSSQHALEEITEIIPLSGDGIKPKKLTIDTENVGMHRKVEDQLREYIMNIACMYRDNFFHNFEHASHVLQSSQKLLNQVVKSDQERSDDDFASSYTHAITSDPLIQFAIVFCSLIHDVDHTGVPNSQLIKEGAIICEEYNNKSIAEQNSLDLAWDLLMQKNYRNLQRAIFNDAAELDRFRQLLVNVVLATDIFDPDHKDLRNSRWEKAFGDGAVASPDARATVVIEYIMQASDVSHTMQHWSVYRRWNERLLEEMYSAYQVNRGEKDPTEFWYKGEIWFFDNYVIPLAKKLKECGVFGAASDECLNYAQKNRDIWVQKGEAVVDEVIARLNKKQKK